MSSPEKSKIKENLQKWNDSHDDRAKLQSAYLALATASLVVAGIVGLVNHGFGQNILLISVVAFMIFLINNVAWALLQSFVILPLSKKSHTKKQ